MLRTINSYRLLLELLRYLIEFAPLASVNQRQLKNREMPTPLIFHLVLMNFTSNSKHSFPFFFTLPPHYFSFQHASVSL